MQLKSTETNELKQADRMEVQNSAAALLDNSSMGTADRSELQRGLREGLYLTTSASVPQLGESGGRVRLQYFVPNSPVYVSGQAGVINGNLEASAGVGVSHTLPTNTTLEAGVVMGVFDKEKTISPGVEIGIHQQITPGVEVGVTATRFFRDGDSANGETQANLGIRFKL